MFWQMVGRTGRRSPLMGACLTLLIACSPVTTDPTPDQSTPTSAPVANDCPVTDPAASRFDVNGQPYLDQLFDYNPTSLETSPTTVILKTPNHDLIYCRATQQWAILPPSDPDQATAEFEPNDLEALSNPDYGNTEIDGQIYQYRAILNPNPFPNYEESPTEVLFELIPPGSSEPIRLPLYTVEDLRETGIGFDLGVPEVRGVAPLDGTLLFGISAEQGEGFSGLTTLVRYNLETNSLEKIQPQNLIGEQITALLATTAGDQVTLWLGTKYSAEGSAQMPAKGLVTYTFRNDDTWGDGETAAYSIHNSPLVGAVPSVLLQEDDRIWVATGSGICQFPWEQVQSWEAWQCWQYALEAEVSQAGLPLYQSLLGTTPATTLTPDDSGKVEVLWWSSLSPIEFEQEGERSGRFEVVYGTGFPLSTPEGGYFLAEDLRTVPLPPWETNVYWPGRNWHWAGDRFKRTFDEVDFNFIALGAAGISARGYSDAGIQDTNTMRGDFELLSLSTKGTELRYFSGWVDDTLLEPYFVVQPSAKKPITTPNPVEAIAPELETF